MCLITKRTEPIILEEDLEVYKLLTKSLWSLFYFPSKGYILDELYITEIKESDDWCCFDNSDELILEKEFPNWKTATPQELICIGQGFHSALKPERIQDGYYSIFKCIIPKGSEIYKEPSGLVVSNQIIIKEKL